MSIYLQRTTYLEGMCQSHNIVLHKSPKGDGTLRNSFFRINNQEEITADTFNKIDYPCVAQMGFEGHMKNADGALVDIRHVIKNEWWFLQHVPLATPDSGEGFTDRIEAAYELTFGILEDFIKIMRRDFEDNGACGAFQNFDINRISYAQLGPVIENEYGWALYFEDEVKAVGVLN